MTEFDNQYCFICGHSNPVGLKAEIKVDREAKNAVCSLVIPSAYQGWKGIVHGGIISALLDELCVYAGMTAGDSVVTGELKTRFRNPVPVEQEVTVSAQVKNQVRRTLLVEAQLTMGGGVLASAEAKLVIVRS